MRRILAAPLAILVLFLSACTTSPNTADARRGDPLPSWNDTAHKRQILDFVDRTTIGPEAYRPEDRIAVFDNDGTLWSEQPIYFQFVFASDRVKALAHEHPEWRTTEPYKSLLEGDMMKALASKTSLMEVIDATHSGMTTEQFDEIVREWARTARHPRTGKLYTEMVFQPMLELMTHLRNRGYSVYIVSGGGVDFMRAFAERVYGVQPEHVIGSQGKVEYVVTDGVPAIVKRPGINFIDDKEGKPVAIDRKIGRRPVIAFGNSDGDFAMLQWTTAGPGPRLGAYIHHTDAAREWAYDRDSKIGTLNKGLDAAPKEGWILVDMKDDWKTIYPFNN